SAAVTGSFVVGFHLPARPAKAENPSGKDVLINAYLRIEKNNRVTFLLDKAEMGQGVITSLPQILCEELGIDINELAIETAPADRVYINSSLGLQITGGSTSVADSYDKLRIVGATVRDMLLQAGAKHLKTSACVVS